MTPIEELNKSINELLEIKKRAEKRYAEALKYLHDFKNIREHRDLHTNETIMIGIILGYKPEKVREDIHRATGDKDE